MSKTVWILCILPLCHCIVNLSFKNLDPLIDSIADTLAESTLEALSKELDAISKKGATPKLMRSTFLGKAFELLEKIPVSFYRDAETFEDEADWIETIKEVIRRNEGHNSIQIFRHFMPGAMLRRYSLEKNSFRVLKEPFKDFSKDALLAKRRNDSIVATEDGIITEIADDCIQVLYYDPRRRDSHGNPRRKSTSISLGLDSSRPPLPVPVRRCYYPDRNCETDQEWTARVALPIISRAPPLSCDHYKLESYYQLFWPRSELHTVSAGEDDVLVYFSLIGTLLRPKRAIVILQKKGSASYETRSVVVWLEEEVCRASQVKKGQKICVALMFPKLNADVIRLKELETYVPGIMKQVSVCPTLQHRSITPLASYYHNSDPTFISTRSDWLELIFKPIVYHAKQLGIAKKRKEMCSFLKIFFPNSKEVVIEAPFDGIVTFAFAKADEVVEAGAPVITLEDGSFKAKNPTYLMFVSAIGCKLRAKSMAAVGIDLGAPSFINDKASVDKIINDSILIRTSLCSRTPILRLNYHPVGLKKDKEFEEWYSCLIAPILNIIQQKKEVMNIFFPESTLQMISFGGRKPQPQKSPRPFFRPGDVILRFKSSQPIVATHISIPLYTSDKSKQNDFLEIIRLSNKFPYIKSIASIRKYVDGIPDWISDDEDISKLFNEYSEFSLKERVVEKTRFKGQLNSLIHDLESSIEGIEKELSSLKKIETTSGTVLAKKEIKGKSKTRPHSTFAKEEMKETFFEIIDVKSTAKMTCFVGPFWVRQGQSCSKEQIICKLRDLNGDVQVIRTDCECTIEALPLLKTGQIKVNPGEVICKLKV